MLEKFLERTEFSDYEDFFKNYKINVPENFNFGYDVVDYLAEKTPNAKALVWCNDEGEELVLTFKQVKERTDRAAAFMLKQGIKKGDFVMLILQRRYEFWISIVALHKIGASVIPATHMLTTEDIVYRCNAAGIKPVLGLEAYVAARKMTDKDPAHDKQRFHVTLIAMNNKGYENLCRIMSRAEEYGKYYKPRTDHEDLEKYNEGIICLSGCMGSEISEAIRAGDDKRAYELIDWYRKVFKDRFYLEMQDHGHPKSSTHSAEQKKVNDWHMKHAKKLGLPLVVTCDAHYLKNVL